MTLPRGFKAAAERTAAGQRALLGLRETSPVDPFALLRHHGMDVMTPSQVVGISEPLLLAALEAHSDCWSAVTVRTPAGVAVVHNPLHETPRQHSNLTHELAHLLLGHRPGRLHTVFNSVMRDFDDEQEEEAAWLGDTILAPRAALAAASRRGMNVPGMAEHLGASTQLVSYRAYATGVLTRRRAS